MNSEVKRKHYWVREDQFKLYSLHNDPESSHVYVGDKLDIGIEIWTTMKPASVIYAFNSVDGLDRSPFVVKTKHLLFDTDMEKSIKSYILHNPKEIYFYFLEERGNYYVRTAKHPMVEMFNQLKIIPENSKNIIRI